MGEDPSSSHPQDPSSSDLVADAEYVCLELARGDGISADRLSAAQPLIATLLEAVYACKGTDNPAAGDMIKLETAMSALMVAIAPVSVQSLRDTQCSGTSPRGTGVVATFDRMRGAIAGKTTSDADRFSNLMLSITVVVLIVAITSTILANVSAPPNPPPSHAEGAKK
jgi:hypothetical protein